MPKKTKSKDKKDKKEKKVKKPKITPQQQKMKAVAKEWKLYKEKDKTMKKYIKQHPDLSYQEFVKDNL